MSLSGDRKRSTPSAADASLAEMMGRRARSHSSVPTAGQFSASWRAMSSRTRPREDDEEVDAGADARSPESLASGSRGSNGGEPVDGSVVADPGSSVDEREDARGSGRRVSPRILSTSTPHIWSFVTTSIFVTFGTLRFAAFREREGWDAKTPRGTFVRRDAHRDAARSLSAPSSDIDAPQPDVRGVEAAADARCAMASGVSRLT